MNPNYQYSPTLDYRRNNYHFPHNFKNIPTPMRKNPYIPNNTTVHNTAKINNKNYSQQRPNTFCSNNINIKEQVSDCNKQGCENDKDIREDIENRTYEQFFEILGIKIYFDDLLILALIFFLYKEEVNDNYLYVILFMLLLS